MSLADELVAMREDRASRESRAADHSQKLIDALYRDHFALAFARLDVVAKAAVQHGLSEVYICEVDEVLAVAERDEFRHFVALRPRTTADDEQDRFGFNAVPVRLPTVDQRSLLVTDATGWVAADESAGLEVVRYPALRDLWTAIAAEGVQPFFRNRDPFRHGRTALWILLR